MIGKILKYKLILVIILAAVLVACQPQSVEVTRIVEGETVVETVLEEREVTRIVEGETITETIVEEVEVTRVVEAAPTPDTRVGGTLRVGLDSDFNSMDLHRTSLGQDANFVGYWFVATLFTQNTDGEYIPYLAKSWDISDDGTVWTFNLREDVKFHNGDPVTADDWVWTFLRAQDPDLAAPVSGRALQGVTVEALDDYTLRLTHEQPNNFLFRTFAHGWLSVMSQRAVEEFGDEYALHPVGAGPYKVTSVRPGEGITMERWDEYNWGPEFFVGANTGPYFFERVEFLIIPEESTRIAALESGDIDVNYRISSSLDVPILEAAGATVDQQLYGQVRLAYIRNDAPPFDDIRVRQAFNYAVNREEASLIASDGEEPPAGGPLSPGMENYDPIIERQCGYIYDLNKAMGLMQEAGYTYDGDGMLLTPEGEPFELTLLVTTEAGAEGYAEVLQSQWRDLGVDIEIEPTEPAVLYPAITAREYTIAFAQRGGFANPDYLYTLYHSSTGGDLPGSFRSAVSDPITDAYLEANRTLLGDELQASVDEMYCYIAEQSYSIWATDILIRNAVGSRVKGAVPGPLGAFRDFLFSNAFIALEDRS